VDPGYRFPSARLSRAVLERFNAALDLAKVSAREGAYGQHGRDRNRELPAPARVHSRQRTHSESRLGDRHIEAFLGQN